MSQQVVDPRDFRTRSLVLIHLVTAILLVFIGVVVIMLPVSGLAAGALWIRITVGSTMLLGGVVRFLKVMQD